VKRAWRPSSPTDPQKREKMLASYTEFSLRKQDFVALLKKQRIALEAVYAKTDDSNDIKRIGKLAVFQNLQDDYQALKRQWGGYAGYDRWFSQKLTNAHLASVATYTDGVPGFRELLKKEGNDLSKFYTAAKLLSEKDRAERNKLLGIVEVIKAP
jgi:predicted aminopeptidase